MGTARLPVAGSGDWPACSARVSKSGYFGPAIGIGVRPRFSSMQILPRGSRVGLERALGLFLLRSLFLPVAVEELVHHRGDLRHRGLVELASQDRGDVFDHAAALRLVDRLRGRPDEEQLRLLLAVLEIGGDVDLDRLVAVGAEVLERRLERTVKAAADLAGPAEVQQQVLLVVADAGLVGLQALHVGEAVRVQVFEQRRESLLELALGDAFENRDVRVDVDFEPHGENLGRGWPHSTFKISPSWKPASCPRTGVAAWSISSRLWLRRAEGGRGTRRPRCSSP